MTRARFGRLVGLLGLAGLLAVWLLAPPATVDRAGRAATRWLGDVPEPVLVGGALLFAVVLWIVLVRSLLGLLYRGWRVVADRVYWALTLVLPESPLVKFAAGATVMIVVVIVIVGGLPALIGSLSAGGAGSYADRLSSSALNAEWEQIVDGDAVGGEPGCRNRSAAGADDRDGDSLPDAWERAGETPDGAALPGADPGRKDLYVQVNHGADVEPLSDREQGQLEAIWARMPVSNPDGSEGVSLHLDVDSERAGGLGESAVFTAKEQRDRYYTADRLGPRRCVYRQVVYGKLRMGRLAGVGSLPGYASIVDGSRQPDYEGQVGFRVAVTTHELLHNVAGRVDGRSHTTEGWLAGGPDNEFLSPATAAELEEGGLFGPAT